MFDITIKNILANIWPMLVIITVILSSLRVVYIIRNKETFVLYREILKLALERSASYFNNDNGNFSRC